MEKNAYVEQLLARNCSPVLAGIKPANLVSADREKLPEQIEQILQQYEQDFSGRGICFRVLCHCERRVLILVYSEKQLQQAQQQPQVASFLHKCGYDLGASLEERVCQLGEKIRQNGEFPHEIGLFLGYPLEDVEGFIRHKGQNFLYSGCWKVYHDVERKQQMFARYIQCRNAVCHQLKMGRSLSRLFCAGCTAQAQ